MFLSPLNPKINGTATWTQQFTYDQLNRIKSGSTLNGGDSFRNTYSYDANGNLKTLERWDKTGAKMDEFAYNYENKGVGYLANTNKLRSVDDKPAYTNVSGTDLDDQDIDNYQYDDIGNLNRDTQEGIANIEWTAYGKVKAVYRVSDPSTKLPTGPKPHLIFEYDASGNRVAKISIDRAGNVIKIHYLRDASGNVMSTYRTTSISSLVLSEQYLYGCTRLGVLDNKGRSYELADHLGNVRIIVEEKKTVASATDYYPFGMVADQYAPSGGYRFGFNGQERENDLNTSTTFAEQWIYDGRLGRRWNTDPVVFSNQSPYATFNGNPIYYNDPSGQSGEVTVDKQKKEVTVSVNLVFYSNSMSKDELADYSKKVTDRIKSDWQNENAQIDINGENYKINFNVTYSTKTVPEAETDAKNNKDIKNNYFGIETAAWLKENGVGGADAASATGTNGTNLGVFIKEEIDLNKKTEAHEFGHM